MVCGTTERADADASSKFNATGRALRRSSSTVTVVWVLAPLAILDRASYDTEGNYSTAIRSTFAPKHGISNVSKQDSGVVNS